MRIRAICNACGRDFLFFHLYNADPWHNDRCPHCHRHLNLLNGRHLALAADRAAASLVNALRAMADRQPGFTIHADSVLDRIEEVVSELSAPPQEVGGDDAASPVPQRQRLRPVA